MMDRVIDDQISDARSRFEGKAVFAPVPGGLEYRETGTLILSGQAFQAERRYLWQSCDAGIAVAFEDGRPFHTIGSGLGPVADHDCTPDRYAGRYDFTDWPAWRVVWSVSGPRKDYTMTTRYSRD